MKAFSAKDYLVVARWLACELWDVPKNTSMDDITARRVVLERARSVDGPGWHHLAQLYDGEDLVDGRYVYDVPSRRLGWKRLARNLKRDLRHKWKDEP